MEEKLHAIQDVISWCLETNSISGVITNHTLIGKNRDVLNNLRLFPILKLPTIKYWQTQRQQVYHDSEDTSVAIVLLPYFIDDSMNARADVQDTVQHIMQMHSRAQFQAIVCTFIQSSSKENVSIGMELFIRSAAVEKSNSPESMYHSVEHYIEWLRPIADIMKIKFSALLICKEQYIHRNQWHQLRRVFLWIEQSLLVDNSQSGEHPELYQALTRIVDDILLHQSQHVQEEEILQPPSVRQKQQRRYVQWKCRDCSAILDQVIMCKIKNSISYSGNSLGLQNCRRT